MFSRQSLFKFGAVCAFAGSGSTLVFQYASDNEKKNSQSLSTNKENKQENYWHQFSRATLHQGINRWKHDWDQTQDSKLDNPSTNSYNDVKRNIILIRHGHYDLFRRYENDRVLTEMGIKQAEATAIRLQQLEIPITSIISSNKIRAIQTAEVLKGRLPPDVIVLDNDSDLDEGCPYPVEPFRSDLSKTFLQEATYEAEGLRIERAFKRYFKRPSKEQTKNSYELIVCHGNVIRYFVCRALQLPPEAWLRMSLKHASITWIRISSEGFCSAHAIGEASHLPPGLLSASIEKITYDT